MKKYNKTATLILLIITVAFVAFSILVSLHVHNCIGDDCPVCQLLNDAKRLIGDTIFSMIAFTFVFGFASTNCLSRAILSLHRDSPVAQRVKITS